MAITTINDLFNAGAEYEAEQWIAGNVTRVDSLYALLVRSYGAEMQASGPTVARFAARVSAGMDLAQNVTNGNDTPVGSVPFGPPGSPEGMVVSRGIISSPSSEDEPEGRVTGLHLPFSIDTPQVITPSEVLDIIRAGGNEFFPPILGKSPDLIKRLEQLQFQQMTNPSDEVEAAIISILRRTGE